MKASKMIKLTIYLLAIMATSLVSASETKLILKTSSGDIYGILNTPEITRQIPVALIISGSGSVDRDGNSPGSNNDSLKMLAESLAATSIATLRYDKRGVGESVYAATSESELRFEHYVKDAAEWIDKLLDDKRFSDVYIIGHSDGALIGMVVAQDKKISGLVSVSATSKRVSDLLRQQLIKKLPHHLLTANEDILNKLETGVQVQEVPKELLFLYRNSAQPYLISWFRYQPLDLAPKLQTRVLYLHGEADLQVGKEDITELAAKTKGSKAVSIPSMNHLMKKTNGKTIVEQMQSYTNPNTELSTDLITEIVKFINKKE